MVQEVITQNKALMKNLRLNLIEAKRDFSAFLTLWKYIQRKQKLQKSFLPAGRQAKLIKEWQN